MTRVKMATLSLLTILTPVLLFTVVVSVVAEGEYRSYCNNDVRTQAVLLFYSELGAIRWRPRVLQQWL